MEVKDLVQGYYGKKVLDGLSFSFDTGESVTILGPNGSGKSTLIKTICRIMKPMSGEITLDGVNVEDITKKEFSKKVAYVPQSTMTFGYTSVFETVLTGRRPYIEWSYSDNDLAIAGDAMRLMHIDHLHNEYITSISGGQKQRAHIARALAQDSDLFVLDEPTSSLDLKHQIDTMSIMKRLTKERSKGSMVALHDLNLALNYSDRVIVLCNSCIYDQGRPEKVITSEMIREVYGVNAEIIEDNGNFFIHPFRPVWEDDTNRLLM